jgi:hypothetical protein
LYIFSEFFLIFDFWILNFLILVVDIFYSIEKRVSQWRSVHGLESHIKFLKLKVRQRVCSLF